MKHANKVVSRIPSRTRKAVQDTVAGCRELAAADLARAALMDTANGRRRFEGSAQSWSSRAELIQQMDDSFDARQAIAMREWEDGEPAADGQRGPPS